MLFFLDPIDFSVAVIGADVHFNCLKYLLQRKRLVILVVLLQKHRQQKTVYNLVQ